MFLRGYNGVCNLDERMNTFVSTIYYSPGECLVMSSLEGSAMSEEESSVPSSGN